MGTPLRRRAGRRPQVKILPAEIEIWSEGRLVARHERCDGRAQQILNLEHDLEVLERKPGALAREHAAQAVARARALAREL
jgi:hypothetical protein